MQKPNYMKFHVCSVAILRNFECVIHTQCMRGRLYNKKQQKNHHILTEY